MKVAPLQPETIVFDEISAIAQYDEKNNCIMAPDFDFEGVFFNVDVGHGDINPVHSNDKITKMLVAVRVQIENNSGVIAPYKINVKVSGIFKWLNNTTDPVERKDLMVVNGASMLYGTIREMVLSLTSRSVAGAMTLPSFNFLDEKPSKNLAAPEEVIERDLPPKSRPKIRRADT